MGQAVCPTRILFSQEHSIIQFGRSGFSGCWESKHMKSLCINQKHMNKFLLNENTLFNLINLLRQPFAIKNLQ